MGKFDKAKRITGFVLHLLIGGLIIFAGVTKLLDLIPPEAVEQTVKSGLGGKLKLIGTGELITGILLIVPLTSSLGVLLASGFWGGVISFHMSHGESYAPYAVFLVLTWIAAYLRDPLVLSSFTARSRRQEQPS
jgi:hypothetical protein